MWFLKQKSVLADGGLLGSSGRVEPWCCSGGRLERRWCFFAQASCWRGRTCSRLFDNQKIRKWTGNSKGNGFLAHESHFPQCDFTTTTSPQLDLGLSCPPRLLPGCSPQTASARVGFTLAYGRYRHSTWRFKWHPHARMTWCFSIVGDVTC